MLETFIAIFQHSCHLSVMLIVVKEPIMFEHTQQHFQRRYASAELK